MEQYISSVQLVDGSVYQIKDAEAREVLDDLLTEEWILDGGTAEEWLPKEEN